MNHQIKNHIGLLSAICGSLLLGVPAIAQTNPSTKPSQTPTSREMCVPNSDASSSSTQGSSSVNSNRNTPTTETDRDRTPSVTETAPSSGSPNLDKQMRRDNTRIIPPTPEQQQAASAMVRPTSGMVNIKLVNETGANIVYEAIGETNQRNLPGQTTITLQRLDTPSTITFYRADGGLLRVRPQAVAPGVLEVRFAATTDLGIDKNSLTVQPSGAVYLN